jgi:hypothetical protein
MITININSIIFVVVIIILFFIQIAEETDNLRLLTEGKSDWASSSSKFKGRGIIQLTGSRNYENFGKYCRSLGDDVNFLESPEKINEPKYAVLSAFWFYQKMSFTEDILQLSILGPETAEVAREIEYTVVYKNKRHFNSSFYFYFSASRSPCFNCFICSKLYFEG